MTIESFKNALSDLSLIHWLVAIILGVVGYLFFLCRRALWYFRKEHRLYSHLRRKIMMIAPSSDTVKQNAFADLRRFLLDSEFFNIPEEPGTTGQIDRVDNNSYCLLLLAYDPEMKNWESVFNVARNHKLPVLIYTFGDRSVDDTRVKTISQEYPYFSYAQNPLSVTNALFTTLATFNPCRS